MTDEQFIALPLEAQRAIIDEMRDGQALADRWERVAKRALKLGLLCWLGMIVTNAGWLWIVTQLIGRIGGAE
ncbi:hypothetical protein E6C67_14255 [Azospirillum sp. TSA2s]|uniref:hypothetical protein n=1 Tax=Azospirillum sp. TSA2s TaxID=709810 RepID=UPI0010A9DC26|nr:hypothetical protein [Azospirillum sp. TSA2s]QCG94991.1 hypothetical protein E6C67_14255 [Azospirillum sp. TSA2s]